MKYKNETYPIKIGEPSLYISKFIKACKNTK